MRTQVLHLPESEGDTAAPQERRQRHVYEANPSGNAVVLEEQMAKLSETAIAHQLATQLYKKYLGLVRMAATSRG
jgi:flagellar basal-body rod protein FlgB